MRVCPVCTANLDDLGKRRDAIYCTGACRAEASRRRLGRPSAARYAHRSARRGQGGRNRRLRSPDLRIHYDKAVHHVTTAFAGPPVYVPPSLARRLAEEGLRAALSERQRGVVEERGAKA